MAKRDGPTTMGPPQYIPGAIRSGRRMNDDARQQRAVRVLTNYVGDDTRRAAEIRKALKGKSPFDLAKQMKLLDEPVVADARPKRGRKS